MIGTSRHEARRIDNQLRGRAGRQGDPGSSQFYVSLEDDLMRIFGGDRIKNLMNTLGLPDDVPIENALINRSIESAQRKVEGHNFDVRKHLVEYDDVMNKHREVIYRKRRQILERSEGFATRPEYDEYGEEIPPKTLKEEILEIVDEEIEGVLMLHSEDEDKARADLSAVFGGAEIRSLDFEEISALANELYEAKEKQYGSPAMREIEKAVYLRTIDMLWIEHLTTIDELRTGIGLRGYGQRDPLVEYKQEAFRLFQSLLRQIESTLARTIFKVEVKTETQQPMQRPLEYHAAEENEIGDVDEEAEEIEREARELQKLAHQQEEKKLTSENTGVTTTVRYGGKTVYERMKEASVGEVSTVKGNKKPGRNDPCPCGSGLKYKKCHGR
ncbi:MAG: preprotein translocase subunit SecA [bacterium ADurb.Bin400]|nr:MAG: preprotein translocase subunit SecA [bacterium ADurb.Bin400]